jgi:hypothetical protein
MTDTPPASEIRTSPTRVRRYGPRSEQSSAAGMIPLVPTVHPALVLEEEGVEPRSETVSYATPRRYREDIRFDVVIVIVALEAIVET